MRNKIQKIGDKVLSGGSATKKDILPLLEAKGPDVMELAAVANQVRVKFVGNQIDLCSLLNAKSGRCPEDCAFCAQSVHYKTEAPAYPLMEADQMVKEAKDAQKSKTGRFCLISSGRDR